MKTKGMTAGYWNFKETCEQIRQAFFRTLSLFSFVLAAAALCTTHCLASDAARSSCGEDIPQLFQSLSTQSVCEDASANPQVKEALRLVCMRGRVDGSSGQRAIVIGFLGGFVKHGDRRHPEVWFADYLRDRYSFPIYAEVFSNHERNAALRQVIRLLDTDCNGTLTDSEKKQARIIVFGHSWGASETTVFARELGRLGIPVLLTIQIDIVAKPRQRPSLIPSNVEQAVNFFQSTGGLLHGQSPIVAADPDQTKILGDILMTYANHPIDCGNFPWFARTFNKSHHEIENDARVWDQVKLIIDSGLNRESQVDQEVLAASKSR
jgi:hypothetical protein